jgi:alpha-amylase/alpha-mannosidase (GH57 family)
VPSRVRAVCIHGHYYQPPREHPWLGVMEPEPTAAPDRDWNVRILRECYAPNADARILDAHGRLRAVASNYAWTSFNVGPTLDAWLATHAPALVDALVDADGRSRERTGCGNAWAQAYNHTILPLTSARDVRTQVAWGARAFERRYGRRPEGMWLPEMAVDVPALEALAAAGVTLTMLSPHQVRRVRPMDGGAWRDVSAETLDVRRLYRCRLPSGAWVDVVFRDATVSQALAFGDVLRDGGGLAEQLRGALGETDGAAMVTIATDGETFGHHHRFGEMAVAFAIETLRREGDVAVTNPAAFRAVAPPAAEVEIVERSSWSCVHGIERWRGDCGCRTTSPPEWTQAWRAPLRAAIDWLRDRLDAVFETSASAVMRDPWAARERYVDAILEPERAEAIVGGLLRPGSGATDLVQARRALEMTRHGLLMQTSCGWFFDDVAGVEATLVIRQAGRAIDLARALGVRLENEFMDRLAGARSNVPASGTGADVYGRAVLARPVHPDRIAATAVVLDRLGEDVSLPGYRVTLGGREENVTVALVEETTGARTDVAVHASPAGAVPSCEAGGRRYDVTDLFLVQRERLVGRVAGEAVRAVRAARHEALGSLRAVIDPLLGRPSVPLELAMLLGYEEADRLVAAIAEERLPLGGLASEVIALEMRGVTVPARVVTRSLAARLAKALDALPAGAPAALEVLDFAAATGLALDLAAAQVRVARWWQAAQPAADPTLTALRDRLGLSPELGTTPD